MEEVPSVVVVSGSEGVRAQLRLTLGTERFDVVEAQDTCTAASVVAARLPALVVLDADLPDGGARGLIESLRARPATAAVRTLLLTSRAEGTDVPDVMDAVLALPTTAFTLLRRVESLVGDRSQPGV